MGTYKKVLMKSKRNGKLIEVYECQPKSKNASKYYVYTEEEAKRSLKEIDG